MKISIGSDHGGLALKNKTVRILKEKGHEVNDVGTYSNDSVDYPDFAHKTACAVAEGTADRGILICKTGIGMSIAANKYDGIRAALCRTPDDAEMSRRHNDANILVLSGKQFQEHETEPLLKTLLTLWLTTPFEGGRHKRRIDKLSPPTAD